MSNEQDKSIPKITPEHVDSKIKSVAYHIFEGTNLTVCCMTLENGFVVTGESACVSPKLFDQKIGEELARDVAREKVWMLEGYLLAERLHASSSDD